MDLTEKTIRKHYVFRGKIIDVCCDDAELSDGTPCKREIVEHSGGAAAFCVIDGKVVLVRQYRYAYGEELLEIPAGKLNAGEDPMEAARRELEEETGLLAEQMKLLFTLYPSPGYTNEKIYIYRADSVKKGRQHLDEGEFLNVVYLSLEEAAEMVKKGEIRDAKTVAALLSCVRNEN